MKRSSTIAGARKSANPVLAFRAHDRNEPTYVFLFASPVSAKIQARILGLLPAMAARASEPIGNFGVIFEANFRDSTHLRLAPTDLFAADGFPDDQFRRTLRQFASDVHAIASISAVAYDIEGQTDDEILTRAAISRRRGPHHQGQLFSTTLST